MCFEFGSCFGGGRRDDYGGERSNRNEAGGRRRGRRGNNNSNGYYASADQDAAYHSRPASAVDEAGHKAYHDGAGYAAYTQHKADVGTSKLPGDPAWHNKVGDHGYTGRLQEARTAAMDYHHYPTTTTTALGRY
ncbi:hypothetical protein CFC21_045632 [Triticum aestivum]|uniref:Uncharacterized protein n=2 Tax=Triticum aestivum TaxID=4565 RepID=A0A3B6GQA0_WHEAT|nr:hypothetical protein CFC21_045632 [Triticum aestivum]